MAIINFQCEKCDKSHVCKWYSKIEAFSEDKKNPIGVTIQMNECEEFKEV